MRHAGNRAPAWCIMMVMLVLALKAGMQRVDKHELVVLRVMKGYQSPWEAALTSELRYPSSSSLSQRQSTPILLDKIFHGGILSTIFHHFSPPFTVG